MGMCKVSGDSHFHASLSLRASVGEPVLPFASASALGLSPRTPLPLAFAGLSWRLFSPFHPLRVGLALWPRAAVPALALGASYCLFVSPAVLRYFPLGLGTFFQHKGAQNSVGKL